MINLHTLKSVRAHLSFALYADDILLAYNDSSSLHETKHFLGKNFDMKDMNEFLYVLGIEIYKDGIKRALRLSQKAFTEKVLENF